MHYAECYPLVKKYNLISSDGAVYPSSLSRTGLVHPLDRIRCKRSLGGGGSAVPARSQHRGPDQCKLAFLLLTSIDAMHVSTVCIKLSLLNVFMLILVLVLSLRL